MLSAASFDRAVHGVMLSEGGYVDHPHDPGGATKYGVSLRFLLGIWKQRDERYLKIFGTWDQPTRNTVKLIHQNQARALAYEFFWRPCWCDQMSPDIAYAVFDFAYNAGPAQSIKILQRALNDQGLRLKVDGRMGNNTIRALTYHIADKGDDALLSRLRFHREQFYKSLVQRSAKFASFLRGWLIRAAHATKDTNDLPNEQ